MAIKNFMKTISFNFKLLVFVIILSSCSSKKNIYYLQDTSSDEDYSIQYEEYSVKVDDILKIDINSENPDAAVAFNPKGLNFNGNAGKEALLYNGYQVDFEGNINLPSIGKIYILNKTIGEVRDLVYSTIVERNILINPSVDVKLLNAHFTVLGEVAKPGKYSFLSNNMNILEAIGTAGDLTINGLRKDVKLIREINSKKIIYSIDLTKSDFISNKQFQIFSGDVIIVNPNNSRVKNAGIIGNSGTLLSLLSFILSLVIVISNR